MKKILYVIRNIFLGIGVVLMAIFYTLLSVVLTPFRALRYRKSHFARDTGANYDAEITHCQVYTLYNALREQNIPIEAVCHPRHPKDAHLVWKKTLVIHEFDSICFRGGRWVMGPDSDVWKDGLDLKEAIAEVLDDVFDDRPGFDLDDAVILIDRADVAPADLDRAARSPLFLLYSNDAEQLDILRRFCAGN